MTAETPAGVARPRRRPADRRDIVLATAASAFSAHGYAATRLADIADEVGISTPALYRHFDTKYALFAATVDQMSRRVADTVDAVSHDDDPRHELAAVLTAFAEMTVEHRSTGNLYRWEHQVLADADRAFTREVRIAVHRRVRGLVAAARPDLDRDAAGLLAISGLSVAASSATHRASMGKQAAARLLADAAVNLLDVRLPPRVPPAARPRGLAPVGRREAILTAAVPLFAARGFHEVTVTDIGAAAGVPASGVYRHFPSKDAILAAALWRTADRTTDAVAAALTAAQTPAQALVALADRYSALCVESPNVMTVYLHSLGEVGDDDRKALRRAQRQTVDEWATWVTRARPEVTMSAARFLVHASLNVATDLVNGSPGVDQTRVAAICARVLTG